MDGFFRWVWRINGLILLLLLLLGAISLAGTLVSFKHHRQAPDGMATLGRPDQPDRHQAPLKLGRFQALPGTSVLYAQLGNEGVSVGSLSSGFTPPDMRNLLFFDTLSRQARWLFDDNAQSIAAMSVISEPAPPQTQGAKPDCKALGVLLLTRPAQADNRDEASWGVRLASVDGRQVKTLAARVDTLLDHQLADDHTLLVFYAKQGTAHVLDVDPATREVRSDLPLAGHN